MAVVEAIAIARRRRVGRHGGRGPTSIGPVQGGGSNAAEDALLVALPGRSVAGVAIIQGGLSGGKKTCRSNQTKAGSLLCLEGEIAVGKETKLASTGAKSQVQVAGARRCFDRNGFPKGFQGLPRVGAGLMQVSHSTEGRRYLPLSVGVVFWFIQRKSRPIPTYCTALTVY